MEIYIETTKKYIGGSIRIKMYVDANSCLHDAAKLVNMTKNQYRCGMRATYAFYQLTVKQQDELIALGAYVVTKSQMDEIKLSLVKYVSP